MTSSGSPLDDAARKAAHGYTSVARQARKLATKILGTRRRRIAAASSTVIIIALIVAAGALGAAHRTAQMAADKAAAAAEVVAAQQADDARLLDALRVSARTASEDTLRDTPGVTPWADPAVLANVEATRLRLVAAITNATDITQLRTAYNNLATARQAVGTRADSENRAYVAARAAAGITDRGTPAELAPATAGHSYCENLTRYYSLPEQAALQFNDNTYKPNLEAITVFCPEFQTYVDNRVATIDDGNYAVAAEASPFGVTPMVLAAGTYFQPPVTNCYWARATGGGAVIANDFVANSVAGFTVTLRAGEGFTSTTCRPWVKQ